MSFIIKSFLGGVTAYTLWGVLLKISFLLVCIGIVLLILLSKRRSTACKTCGQQVGVNEKYCHKCGVQFTANNIEVKAGAAKKVKTIYMIFTAAMLCLFAFSVIAAVKNITMNNYATGMYSGYHQLYMQNDKMWGVECDNALTEGSFNHLVTADSIPTAITVTASCDSGTLILNVKQGEKIQSYDITNTDGEQVKDLSWLEAGTQVQFSVEHTVASNIDFLVSGE